jgi:hypothetical protein
VNLALGLILMPFTVRHLGTSQYGLWMLVASLTGYFQLLDLGYGNGLVRHVADADARGDMPGINRLLSTFAVLYAGLGLLAAAGIAVLIFTAVPRFPDLSAEQIRTGQLVLAVLGRPNGDRVSDDRLWRRGERTPAIRPQQRRRNRCRARQRSRHVSGPRVGIRPAAARGQHGGRGSGQLRGLHLDRAPALPGLRIRIGSFDRRLVRDVTTFSLYLFIIDVAVQIGFNLDNVVIGAALGTSAVAVYAVILRLADYQRQLACQFQRAALPHRRQARRRAAGRGARIDAGRRHADRLDSRDRRHHLRRRVRGAAAGALDGARLRSRHRPLLGPRRHRRRSRRQGPLGNILLGTGHHRLVAFVSLGEAVANLALSVLLVRRFGMLGVAVGTARAVVAANLFILLPAAAGQFGMTTWTFLRRVLPAPAAGLIPAVVACAVLRSRYPPASIGAILAEGAIVGFVYLAAVCVLGFDRQVRTLYLDYLRAVLGPARVQAPAGKPVEGMP